MKSCQASHVRIDLLCLQDENHGEQFEFFFHVSKEVFFQTGSSHELQESHPQARAQLHH